MIVQYLYYRWSKDFLEADKKRLAGDNRCGNARPFDGARFDMVNRLGQSVPTSILAAIYIRR